METDLVQLALGVVALPFHLVHLVVFAVMNFLVFDLLRLGSVLPIRL